EADRAEQNPMGARTRTASMQEHVRAGSTRAKQNVLRRDRLLAIIKAADQTPEPRSFSYLGHGSEASSLGAGRPFEGYISVRQQRNASGPQLGLLAELIRACRSREEAAQLVERAGWRETTSEVMVFWRGMDWSD